MEQSRPIEPCEMLDVKGLLEQASDGLEMGEMIMTQNFDLFHVMSAVEIGDPRLDAGRSINPLLSSASDP